jgi:dihydroneopterin aldolase
MKKHVEGDHYALMKRLAKDVSYIVVAKVPIN